MPRMPTFLILVAFRSGFRPNRLKLHPNPFFLIFFWSSPQFILDLLKIMNLRIIYQALTENLLLSKQAPSRHG